MRFGALFLLLLQSSLSAAGPDAWAGPAAKYLDARMEWWSTWNGAARDHGTFCVSCHTSVPYAIARPLLQAKLGDAAVAGAQKKLVDNVTSRVRIWKDAAPFYPDKKADDPKTIESRGTESILNALVLTSTGFTPDAEKALDNMWSEQLADGSWNWLQFHNAPWEGDSQFYGTVLAAWAAGNATKTYSSTPAVTAKIQLMRNYLAKNQASQKLIDRVTLLLVSSKLEGLLSKSEQAAITKEVLSKQQADGGYGLGSLEEGWKRRDNTELEAKSDGYATGIVTLALLSTGVPKSAPAIQKSIAWMQANQNPDEGRWLAYSMNKKRDLATDIGKFMSDAATAYCAMALAY